MYKNIKRAKIRRLKFFFLFHSNTIIIRPMNRKGIKEKVVECIGFFIENCKEIVLLLFIFDISLFEIRMGKKEKKKKKGKFKLSSKKYKHKKGKKNNFPLFFSSLSSFYQCHLLIT